jgi:CRP/FNR family transcriptional regulator, cyclic AMP receptor protein
MRAKQSKYPDASLLEALPPVVRELAKQGTIRRYRANTTLIEEGDRGDTIFVILSGMLRIYCAEDSGKEITLAMYGPGEYVGEMSLDGGVRSASVVTEIASACAVVSGSTIRQHIATHPDFAMELIQRLIRRTRLATDSARSLALLDAYGRLAHLFDMQAVARPDGTRLIKERLTHLEISRRIGCTRELVSRILKDLGDGGYIAQEERRYVLLNKLPQKW